MNYKIVVDSTCYLSEEEFREFGIRRASLNIIDKDATFKELDVDNQFVHSRLDSGHRLTTSQPSPGEFFDIYEDLLKEGADKIFVITLAPPLSGTYQSAVLARTMLDEPNRIHIFESKMAAFGNEMLVLQLQKYIDQKLTELEIIKKIDAINQESNLIFTVENLHHLSKSGRLSKPKALIGSVLRVKPLLHMVEGKLDLYKAERTHKKVISSIVERIKETTVGAKIVHIRLLSHSSNDNLHALKSKIEETIQNTKITVTNYLGPVFNLHVGKVGYGVAWCVES